MSSKIEKKPLKILQWNCRSLSQRLGDLFLLEEELSPDIICLSETTDSNTINVSNYNIVTKNRTSRSGGTTILINKNLKFICTSTTFFALALDNLIDIICIKLSISGYDSLYVCSLYSSPRKSGSFTADNLWTNLLCSLASLGRVVVCGDFNGHNSLWSNHHHLHSNPEGCKIESALEIAQLSCMK